ncbi:MAG: lytic transglycosylase [Betaproteobacteria bacterium]|nr:lytic transglycosylase [Betaproteobacteria bacterium]
MQPLARALLLAAGFFVTLHLSSSRAAELEPAEPVTLPHMNRDSAAETPAAAPAIDAATPDVQSPIAAPPPPAAAAPAAPTAFAPTLMDLTLRPSSLWQRIRNGFGLPDMSSPLVREQEDWYARRPDYISRTVARSSRYLYYIVQQIEKRNMPSEIALLPIIESAYNPVAYSRAHASGIWQFIPSTGKMYGLQQNFWYDGRRDVTAATNAALDYLEKLYEMFGTWDLALAAYNWGEGAVSRAVAKNVAKGLPTDYRSLTMPAETRYYMPKLQAVKNIIANPAQFGIDLAEVPNQPYFVEVPTTKHIDVKLAAKMAGMEVEEFQSLNPGNSRAVIRADGERVLLVPADKADSFRSNMANHDEPLVSWQAYKLKPGETLDRIATRYGTSAAQLRAVNGISPKHGVTSGSTLLVPAGATSKPYLPDLPAPTITVAKGSKKAAKQGGRKKVAAKTTRRPVPAKKSAAVKGGKKAR